MTSEPPISALPRNKPNVLWWLGGILLLLIFLFCLQLFGPAPPIIVSKETTYITEPVGPDGLPDYEGHLLSRLREGITPENNAAALIWQALWPGELDPSQYAAVARELGLEQIPLEEDALQPVYNSNRGPLQAWLKDQEIPINRELADEIIARAGNRPWTSAQLPPLADWVRNNQEQLDMLVEASRRPRCYFPSPSLLDNERESLVAMLLPGVQSAREAGRSLSVRAMWNLGENRPDPAWQDLLAMHRLGRLVAQGQTLIDKLVGIAIDGIAMEGTQSLLSDDKLTAEQARQIERDLAALPHFDDMAQSLDQMERLSALDSIALCSKQGIGALFGQFGDEQESDPLTASLDTLSIDWNAVLAELNHWYDRLAEAAHSPDWQMRKSSLRQIYGDMDQLYSQTHQPAALAAGVFSRAQRSRLVAGHVVTLFLPALDAAMNAQDRANTKLDVVRLAAALAVYRTDRGAYPEKLDELVPHIIDKLPADLYHAKPFVYKRIDDGYLLYNLGENGLDDGGSNDMYNFLEGHGINDVNDPDEAERLRQKIPNGADDHSIRLPRPAFELPKR